MSRIVHISDLHFGALDPKTIEPLLTRIEALEPDVVVISGDLTQRARRGQYEDAAAFIERIPIADIVIVPGNHDIPLWNPWRRFVNPRRDFRRCIEDNEFPIWRSDDAAMIGIDTARSLTIKNGRVNREQLKQVASFFARVPEDHCRIVVAHHPFVLPEDSGKRVGRAEMALASLLDERVDLLLTGHRHVSWVSTLGSNLLTVHAGTATSNRRRAEPNSFNEIVINEKTVEIRPHHFDEDDSIFVRDDRSCWHRHLLRVHQSDEEQSRAPTP